MSLLVGHRVSVPIPPAILAARRPRLQRTCRELHSPFLFFALLAVVAAFTLALSGALAGDEAQPTSSTPTAATDAPVEKAESPSTKTPSPVHSLMGWMATAVFGDLESPCPSCPKAEAAWNSPRRTRVVRPPRGALPQETFRGGL